RPCAPSSRRSHRPRRERRRPQRRARARRRDPGERRGAQRGERSRSALSPGAGARDRGPGAAAALPGAGDDHVRRLPEGVEGMMYGDGMAMTVRLAFRPPPARSRLVADHRAGSPELAPLVARRPGLRVPGAWDAFELAVRAVLGQQVTVRGATTLAGRLVRAFGTPLDRAEDGLTHLFPRPEALADADLAALGLPRARAATIRALAGAVASGEVVLDASRGLEDAVARLAAVPGLRPWPADYLALRAA